MKKAMKLLIIGAAVMLVSVGFTSCVSAEPTSTMEEIIKDYERIREENERFSARIMKLLFGLFYIQFENMYGLDYETYIRLVALGIIEPIDNMPGTLTEDNIQWYIDHFDQFKKDWEGIPL